MNDLISRKMVIDILKQSGIIVDNVRGNLIIEEINRIPTAYDVDKVIEQLEDYGKYKGLLRITDNPANCDNYVPVMEVKKIVKGAVKDE